MLRAADVVLKEHRRLVVAPRESPLHPVFSGFIRHLDFGHARPWAASLFFAHDEQLNLSCISSMNSNHVKGFLAADTVVVTVIADHKNWKNIRSLQIFGKAQHLDQDERFEAEGLYLQKFEKIRHVLSAASTMAERKISEWFLQAIFSASARRRSGLSRQIPSSF